MGRKKKRLRLLARLKATTVAVEEVVASLETIKKVKVPKKTAAAKKSTTKKA